MIEVVDSPGAKWSPIFWLVSAAAKRFKNSNKRIAGGRRFEMAVRIMTAVVVSVLAFCLPSLVGAAPVKPSVSISLNGIEKTDDGFVIRGRASSKGPVSGGGESHSYSLSVIVDIKKSGDAQFPKLPDYMKIRIPAGAETDQGPGSGPGGLMTRAERDGVGCLKIQASPKGPSGEFEIKLPAQYAGKTIRVRAFLNYQYNNVGTPWPLIRYYHDIAYTGPLVAGNGGNNGAGSANQAGGSGSPNAPPGVGPALSDTPPIDIPQLPAGNIMGTLADPEVGGKLGGMNWAKPLDEKAIQEKIDYLDKQIADPNTPHDLKAMFNATRNELIRQQAAQQIVKTWLEGLSNMTLDAADKALGYHPVTGPYWAVTKAIYQASTGNWQDAMVTATGVIDKITVAGKVIKDVGTKISLFQDGFTVLGEFVPGPSSKSTGCHQTKCHGYSHHYYK